MSNITAIAALVGEIAVLVGVVTPIFAKVYAYICSPEQ